jgi:DNA polymerase-3 subunit gamma/tau
MEYAESLTVGKIYLQNTLISCKPSLKEDYLIEVPAYNPNQKNEISDSRAEILAYLCGKLHNSRIKMEIRIVEKDEKEMVYTALEKYNYLVRKNPNLEKLKDSLDLTVE